MTERQKIFEAALEVFAEIGVARSNLAMIAERAGLDPAAVRCLFVDQEALLRQVLEEMSTPLISAISMAVEQMEDPRDMIRESMRLFDNWLYDHPLYVRVLHRCMLDDPESLQVIYERSMYPSEYFEKLRAYAGDGQIRVADA
ncbi:MAG: TetR/AcrR family transcriptional regulator, partial [candidate division Zixibacteria bacterium]|nr:TetR/AcrR family transcriptional regulator [candidate division Zixibacteria bacterium]